MIISPYIPVRKAVVKLARFRRFKLTRSVDIRASNCGRDLLII